MSSGRLRPLYKRLHKLRSLIDRKSEIRLGTVAQVSPLMVNLDGDIDADPGSPTFGDPIPTPATSPIAHTVGQRVICAEQYRRVLVVQGSTALGHLYSTASQNVASAASQTMLTFGGAPTLTGGFTAGTDTLIVPVKGLYEVAGAYLMSGNSTGRREVFIFVNGTAYVLLSYRMDAPNALPVSRSVSGVIPLNAGDAIDIRCLQTSGSTLAVTDRFLFARLIQPL